MQPRAPGDVVSGPPADDGRQVVRGGGGHRLGGPLLGRQEGGGGVSLDIRTGILVRRLAFEPQHVDAHHPARGQCRVERLRHRAEVLADDDGALPPRFDRHQPQQVVQRIGQVGARRGRRTGWHQPHPRQPQHVVDAQPAGMGEVGAQHLDKGGVAVAAQPARREHRHAPVLPERVVDVRRRAGVEAVEDLGLAHPRVAAAGVGAHGEIGDQPHGHAGGARAVLGGLQPLRGEPLQEGVIADLLRILGLEGGYRRAVWRAQRHRPLAPVGCRLPPHVISIISGLRQQAGLDGLEAGVGQQPAAAPRAEGGEGLLGVCAKQGVVTVPQPAQQRMARHG